MKSGDGTPTAPFKQSFYEIVLKSLRRADVCLQSNGTWIFFITRLAVMVYRGSEYVQPCLYGRKSPKEAIFGGIQHYQVGLPHNPIVKRVYKNWTKQNPIDPKGKTKKELLWIYPKDFDGLQQLVRDWPSEEKQRRIEAAEEAEYYQWQLENGYFDNDEEEEYDGYHDGYWEGYED